MENNLYIMMGRSGSGKGTQAALLKEYLEEKGEQTLHLSTGVRFREFLQGGTYTAVKLGEIMNNGGLNPAFFAIWNWAGYLIDELKGGESIIFDGAPRKMVEVGALHDMCEFYGYKRPIVIYLDVSEQWARERLAGRGRNDDAEVRDVDNKMEWFLADTLPCIEWYKGNPNCDFIHINAERPIESVREDILKVLALRGGER